MMIKVNHTYQEFMEWC